MAKKTRQNYDIKAFYSPRRELNKKTTLNPFKTQPTQIVLSNILDCDLDCTRNCMKG